MCITSMLGASILIIPAAMVSDPMLTVTLLSLCNFFIFVTLAPSWAAAMDVAGGFSGSVSSVMNMLG